MRVLTYTRGTEERAGLLVDQAVYDVEACSSFFGMPPLPPDLLAILRCGLAPALRNLHERIVCARQAKTELPLACWAGTGEIRILAPVRRPPKIICVGLNYRDHAAEQGARLPEMPLIFAKAPTAVIATGEPIVIPKESEKVDYEGELALVVEKRLKRVDAAEAAQGIFGYCCMNDVTEREIQKERVWFRAKSIDTFAPLGPWIVSGDELGDPLKLRISTRVNSQVMQSSLTGNLIFGPSEIISFITRHITLEPGDIVATGTPGGVGTFRKPPVYLRHGDVVEITIEGIGTLSNPVVRET